MEHPENNEKPTEQKSKVKFKIMSLKVQEGTDFVPELVRVGHRYDHFVFTSVFIQGTMLQNLQ